MPGGLLYCCNRLVYTAASKGSRGLFQHMFSTRRPLGLPNWLVCSAAQQLLFFSGRAHVLNTEAFGASQIGLFEVQPSSLSSFSGRAHVLNPKASGPPKLACLQRSPAVFFLWSWNDLPFWHYFSAGLLEGWPTYFFLTGLTGLTHLYLPLALDPLEEPLQPLTTLKQLQRLGLTGEDQDPVPILGLADCSAIGQLTKLTHLEIRRVQDLGDNAEKMKRLLSSLQQLQVLTLELDLSAAVALPVLSGLGSLAAINGATWQQRRQQGRRGAVAVCASVKSVNGSGQFPLEAFPKVRGQLDVIWICQPIHIQGGEVIIIIRGWMVSLCS